MGVGVDQHAGVEHTSDDHADAARRALFQEPGTAPIEQRVAAGEQHAVEIDSRDEALEHRRLVHPAADRRHDAFVA